MNGESHAYGIIPEHADGFIPPKTTVKFDDYMYYTSALDIGKYEGIITKIVIHYYKHTRMYTGLSFWDCKNKCLADVGSTNDDRFATHSVHIGPNEKWIGMRARVINPGENTWLYDLHLVIGSTKQPIN